MACYIAGRPSGMERLGEAKSRAVDAKIPS